MLLDPMAGEIGSGGGGASTTTAETDTTFSENDDLGSEGDQGASSASGDEGGAGDVDITGSPSPTPTGATAAATDWTSIRDAAKGFGFNVPGNFQDDASFLQHVLRQADQNRQADFYSRLGQQLAPHANQIQQFLGQQQGPKPVEGPKPWEAPEFDEKWLAMVDRDPQTGIFYSKPGANPVFAEKLNSYSQWKTNYDKNPAGVLNGMVEARAKAIAQETVREQFQVQQRESAVREIVQQNTPWLYQRDQQGNVVRDYNNQPMTTPVGARYLYHLQSVRNSGVTDPRTQDTFAKQLVQGELYASQQAAAAQQANQNPAARRQATNSPNINPLQTQPPTRRQINPGSTEPKITGKSLTDLLREELAAEGVTDEDIRSSMG
jgi:hypothetical protein